MRTKDVGIVCTFFFSGDFLSCGAFSVPLHMSIGHRLLSGVSGADMLLSNFVIPLCEWPGYVLATMARVCA